MRGFKECCLTLNVLSILQVLIPINGGQQIKHANFMVLRNNNRLIISEIEEVSK